MCGITGLCTYNAAPIDLEALQEMTCRLRHRGPDDEGYLLVNTHSGDRVLCGGKDTCAALGLPSLDQFRGRAFDLAFGFRRLAILDLSPSGHQPMSSPDGRLWIVFNGEVYNYVELRQTLTSCGHSFRTGTDTEVILAAYQQWGAECLNRLNGMWGLAIWDQRERCLFLARDRFGIKPLYYVQRKGSCAFASEIKALVGRQGLSFEPDDGVVYRYLVGGLLPSPRRGQTFFKGVQALPPGHWMTVSGSGEMTLRRYWSLSTHVDEEGPDQSADEVVQQYRDLFTDAVRLRLRADVPIGTCLSGGVDSSSIVCVVNRLMAEGGLSAEQIGRRQRTFSAIYETEGRYNERAHVDKVLRATDAEGNFTFPTAERLQADMQKLIWHQDEPFQSTSIFAQWCVMSRVRERGVTVLLDGQGADEVMGGYRPYVIFLSDLFRHAQFARALREAHAIQSLSSESSGGLLAKALVHQLPPAWQNALRQQRSVRQTDWSVVNPDLATRQRHESLADWLDWPEQRSLSDHLGHLVEESSLPHLLRYEDRNSMAFSIEARVPFLDYRLVEYSFRRGAQWHLRQGWTKWMLRQAMDGIVPTEIIGRTDKIGFETPEQDWLRRWVASGLNIFDSQFESGKYLDLSSIEERLLEWSKGGGNAPVWRWINLEMWLRVWKAV